MLFTATAMKNPRATVAYKTYLNSCFLENLTIPNTDTVSVPPITCFIVTQPAMWVLEVQASPKARCLSECDIKNRLR
jgi:hypothetical protein